MEQFTTGDKILQSVLTDQSLMKLGDYTPTGRESIDDALCDENPVIKAVAMIINGNDNHYSEKDIYNQVLNHLTKTL